MKQFASWEDLPTTTPDPSWEEIEQTAKELMPIMGEFGISQYLHEHPSQSYSVDWQGKNYRRGEFGKFYLESALFINKKLQEGYECPYFFGGK